MSPNTVVLKSLRSNVLGRLLYHCRRRFVQLFSELRVRFIFLHKSLTNLRGWKRVASETVCARNSRSQDGIRVAGLRLQRLGQAQPRPRAGRVESAGRSSRPRTSQRGGAAAGCRLAALGGEVLLDARVLSSRSAASLDCTPHCVAPAWASRFCK